MNRKQFLKSLAQTCVGIGCCGAALGQTLLDPKGKSSQTHQRWIGDLEKKMIGATKTPPGERIRKAEIWIKDLMRNMDDILDEKTKTALMQANGRSCVINAFGVASEEKVPSENAEKILSYYEQKGYEMERKDDATILHFSWGKDHQNPWGLILGDGYCMCPVVETVKEGLSPTFCLCSTGYVQELFRRQLGRPVTVSLIESIMTGGKDCRFKIVIPKA
jgi:predicted ArsR family transcriptional regulator